MNDKISVIVPIYNTEKYIGKCLESIKKQTYKNLEIILVNDGSIDKSEEICKSYIEKDKRFTYYLTSNYGVSHARNFGLDKATGKYIMFIDSDDWLENNMIEILYKELIEKKCDIAVCDYFINFKELQIEHNKLNEEKIINEKNIMLEFLFDSELYGGYLWNKLIKKSIIKDIRFNEKIKIEEDVDFLCQIFENVNSIIYLPQKKLYHYVKRNESAVNFNYSLKDLTKLLALEKKMKIKDEYQIKNLEKLEYEYYVIASQARYILRKYKIYDKKTNNQINNIRKKYFFEALYEAKGKEKIKVILLNIMPITYGKIKDKLSNRGDKK